MPRQPGTRNAHFDDKRRALARAVRGVWLVGGPGMSMRELAEASGASLTNLRHYFGDRDGLYEAVLAECEADAQPILAAVTTLRGDDAQTALHGFLTDLVIGWRHFGVNRIHAVGLAEGLGQGRRGRAYVNHILEPSLQAAERLFDALIAAGRLPPMPAREAALALVAPVLLALLHQHALHGDQCRPLDVDAFIVRHVRGFLHGWVSAP